MLTGDRKIEHDIQRNVWCEISVVSAILHNYDGVRVVWEGFFFFFLNDSTISCSDFAPWLRPLNSDKKIRYKTS